MVDSSSDDDNYGRRRERCYMRLIFAQRKENGEYNQLVGYLERGYYEYYPRYLRIIPDILEDILWRVGPLLQHGAFISTMTICCNLDLPQMT